MSFLEGNVDTIYLGVLKYISKILIYPLSFAKQSFAKKKRGKGRNLLWGIGVAFAPKRAKPQGFSPPRS